MELISLVKLGSAEAVTTVLGGGADPNVSDRKGRTALHWAVRLGNSLIAKRLVRYGANVDATDQDGVTPIEISINQNRIKLANWLVSLTHSASYARRGYSYLHACAAKGNASTLGLLLTYPDVRTLINSTEEDGGRTPLHWAAQTGEIRTVELLLASAVDLNVSDSLGFSPLHVAASEGHTQVARLLLGAGALIDQPCSASGECTALHFACAWGRYDVVKLLLQSGASKDQRDLDGKRPIDMAVESKEMAIMQLLK